MKKNIILALQHVIAMSGATILVPILTGLHVAVALCMAGVGTLIFHLFTKKIVPVFLGSSFAFIAGIISVNQLEGMEYATGGILVSGVVYILIATLIAVIGHKRFIKLFPPIVVAPIILVIGLTLSPVAVEMSSSNWFLAIITILTTCFVAIFAKGFFKIIPVLSGILVGYIVALLTGNIDFSVFNNSQFFSFPDFHFPKFSLTAISIIAPITLVTLIEHIGDIKTNDSVVGKDFIKNPGLHRTILGDGAATLIAGLFGGPANTTYGENTGTLAITKVYNPFILRLAAIFAILLSFSGFLISFIQSIPEAVLGGISFSLFGMIASIGVKQLVDNNIDLSNMKNAAVFFIPLIIGLSSVTTNNLAVIKITEQISFSGLSLSAIIAIILNLLFNIKRKEKN